MYIYIIYIHTCIYLLYIYIPFRHFPFYTSLFNFLKISYKIIFLCNSDKISNLALLDPMYRVKWVHELDTKTYMQKPVYSCKTAEAQLYHK